MWDPPPQATRISARTWSGDYARDNSSSNGHDRVRDSCRGLLPRSLARVVAVVSAQPSPTPVVTVLLNPARRNNEGGGVEPIGAEALGYWYFRLNSCLTIVDFVLHPQRRGPQRTDADVLAVRFPSRIERVEGGQPLVDHDPFEKSQCVELVVAEVKAGLCDLNGPWSEPARGNLTYVLGAVGILPPERVAAACEALYAGSAYEADGCRIRLFALGRTRNDKLAGGVVQVEWRDVVGFVLDRFTAHSRAKADHPQWDETGQRLWNDSIAKSRDHFIAELLKGLG